MDKLKELYPWCKPTASLLVKCYKEKLTQPNCIYCSKGLNNPKIRYCGPSCQMSHKPSPSFGPKKGSIPWNKGIKLDTSKHISKTNPEKWALTKKKIGKANSGEKNGMFGWDDPKQRAKQSRTMKLKILNGEFTPNTNNKYTRFDIIYKGKNYRSSWEASFASIHPDYEYEKIRIKYIGDDGKSHIYISDFYNPISKEVIEIRPTRFYDEAHPKIIEVKRYCLEHGYKYIHIDIDYFCDREHIIDYEGLGEHARKIKHAIEKYKRNRETRHSL